MHMTNVRSIIYLVALFGGLALPGCIAATDESDVSDEGAEESTETAEEAVAGCIQGTVYHTDRFCYLRSCPSASCAPLEGIGAGAAISTLGDTQDIGISCPSYGFYRAKKVSSGTWGWVHYSCF